MDPDNSVPIDAGSFMNPNSLQPYPSDQNPFNVDPQNGQLYLNYPVPWDEELDDMVDNLVGLGPTDNHIPDVSSWGRGGQGLVADLNTGQDRSESVQLITETTTGLSGDDIVCYGMLYRMDVNPPVSKKDIDKELKDGPDIARFSIHLRKEHVALQFKSSPASAPDGSKVDLGYLRSNLTKPLRSLVAPNGRVTVEGASLASDLREQLSKIQQAKTAYVKVGIYLYGPRSASPRVKSALAKTQPKLWLQKPQYQYQYRHELDASEAQRIGGEGSHLLGEEIEYVNPHLVVFPEVAFVPRDFQQDLQRAEMQDQAQGDVEGKRLEVLMDQVYGLTSRADRLSRSEGSHLLKTTLLEHQEQALSFMLQRESGNIPDEFRLWKYHEGTNIYRHVITGEERISSRPEEKGGGLLADEMGMGKTLSTISLITRTLDEARVAAARANEENDTAISRLNYHTRSTLIIVSQELLIDNWFAEVDDHLKDDVTFTKVKYHGQGRREAIKDIVNSDMVITTYNTLNAEYQRFIQDGISSPLHRIGWARVVLDEAHIIRRRTTQFHRCCADLKAKSRWCLTGTPVQNSLDDLASLFKFLLQDDDCSRSSATAQHGDAEHQSYHRNEFLLAFRKNIKDPFERRQGSGSGTTLEAVKKLLVQLMDSLCLRRTRRVLPLPEVVERTQDVRFTAEERRLYDQTKKALVRHLQARQSKAAATGSSSASAGALASAAAAGKMSEFGQFQINLQLSIMCNHGTFQRLHSWTRNRSMRDRIEGGNFDERICDVCEQPLPSAAIETVCVLFSECNHVVCHGCARAEDYAAGGGGASLLLPSPGPAAKMNCPICPAVSPSPSPSEGDDSASVSPSSSAEPSKKRKRDGVPRSVASRDKWTEEPDEQYFNLGGQSTKMDMLVNDIKEDLASTKSIVFSQWTRTLNLIVIHLKREGIDFLRFDGNYSPAQRRHVLWQFSQSDGQRVLLMTTGTGAFGLNLTDANRVFIVEPKWNPSVEEQAISRAIRLKQENKVYVTRYLVHETVEKTIALQQKTKRLWARAGFRNDAQPRVDSAPAAA